MGCFVDSEKWSMSTCVDFIICSLPLVNVKLSSGDPYEIHMRQFNLIDFLIRHCLVCPFHHKVKSNTSTRKNTANGKSQSSSFEKRFLLGIRDATSTWERDGGCGHTVPVGTPPNHAREEWGVGRYHDASSFSPLPSLSFPQIPLAFST
ncbi:hypothetical protein L1887_19841 [Cichorium endivia]|nr:hypothetical protein L1887_19841 [Cichorium endivia]